MLTRQAARQSGQRDGARELETASVADTQGAKDRDKPLTAAADGESLDTGLMTDAGNAHVRDGGDNGDNISERTGEPLDVLSSHGEWQVPHMGCYLSLIHI